MASMNVTLRYFASVREAIGTGSEPSSTSASTVGKLRDELIARGGAYAQALERGRLLRVSLNQVMCDESTALAPNSEVGFFPPVTGG
jgi:molybdopterin synthase sulfur carrier subunit